MVDKTSEMDLVHVDNEALVKQISELLDNARKYVATTVNTALIQTYWSIGKLIHEDLKQHSSDENYKDCSVRSLSKKLTMRYGKGFSKTNIQRIIIFYEYYPTVPSVSGQLTWTHYNELLTIEYEPKRKFYERECENAHWSVRELRRQIASELFERVLIARKRNKQDEIIKLANRGIEITKPSDIMKNPYVLEFLDGKEPKPKYERDLEKALVNEIEKFMLELGKGFMFVGTQQRISIGNDHYYVDMVFYNKILRRYVLIELKNSKFVPSSVGQINQYLNYYKKEVNDEFDKDPIGIILCKDGVKPGIEYALEGINNNIFAANFTTIMPSQLELQEQVDKVIEKFSKNRK